MSNEYKTALTPAERIKCAYLHLVRGAPMQDLAVAFEVNIGRVSEAVAAIKRVSEDPLPVKDPAPALTLATSPPTGRQPA